ncbi:hypothetical protein ExPECSC022_02942 [Escherichia coli]|nr:hypothetical protein ExPECSC022_02942 [Escherichia coli]
MYSTLSINRVTFTPFASLHPIWRSHLKNFYPGIL